MQKNNLGLVGKNTFLMNSESVAEHTFILASSGKGKSAFIAKEALRRGVSYEEVEKELEPTEEQKAVQKERAMKRKEYERKRFEAVRKAFWENSDPDDSELYVLDDCISSLIPNDVEISHHQRESLFMSLPDDIVYSAIKYGISDSVVRDDIYAFVKDNVDLIKKNTRQLNVIR